MAYSSQERPEQTVASEVSRRGALAFGAGGIAVGVAACSGSATDLPKSTGSSTTKATSTATPGAGSSQVSVPVADVPVGGGTILADQKIVVTQPESGTFAAFSAVCPHDGCLVSKVADGSITCPCHNSVFDAASGDRKSGPAPSGLAKLKASVSGSNVVVG